MDTVTLACGHVMNFNPAAGLTTATAGDWTYKASPDATVQCLVSGTGAVSATINVEVSNDGVNACATPAGTITLSGTTSASDGFTSQNSCWKYWRLNVTAISGTGATVTGTIGT